MTPFHVILIVCSLIPQYFSVPRELLQDSEPGQGRREDVRIHSSSPEETPQPAHILCLGKAPFRTWIAVWKRAMNRARAPGRKAHLRSDTGRYRPAAKVGVRRARRRSSQAVLRSPNIFYEW